MNCKPSPDDAPRRAFTLVELLVVIAIIAVLVTLTVPAANRMIQRGHDAKCMSNLKQLAQGVRFYAADHSGRIPFSPGQNNPEGSGWAGLIFPYIYPKGDRSEWGRKNPALSRSKYSVYYCPSAPHDDTVLNAGTYNYAFNQLLAPLTADAANYLLHRRHDVIMIADTWKGHSHVGPGQGAPFALNTARGHTDKGGTERHSGKRDCFVFVDGHVEMMVWPNYSTNRAIWDPNAPKE
jgi:prepilin-type N-terminal cleavage/methylation domain-containing protein